jgi:hypothetical protein
MPALDFDDKPDYEVGDGMKLIIYEEPFRIQVNLPQLTVVDDQNHQPLGTPRQSGN